MTPSSPTINETFARMIREQMPNLFRLYVNPHVTQVCYCLEQYAQMTWEERGSDGGPHEFQTYLANGFDEALGGAIKLARYAADVEGRSTHGLIIDPESRLGPFASAPGANGELIEFLPGLTVVESVAAAAPKDAEFGFIALIVGEKSVGDFESAAEEIQSLFQPGSTGRRPLWITAVSRQSLAAIRDGRGGAVTKVSPDIVVFDDSFANRDLAFGAFAARRELYEHWNRKGKTTFHSTTYQPNTICSLHFMSCLSSNDPAFFESVEQNLRAIETDLPYRAALFRRLYSASLFKAIRASGFEKAEVRAAGDFVFAEGGRRVYDGVSGVACSVRGHNPPGYAREIESLGNGGEVVEQVTARLRELSGLEHCVPAVSGATAVENALKMALVAQSPRRRVLALASGFGGKTLFALTGTAKPSYKQHIAPLYDDVVYVDPFAPDALARIDRLLAEAPVAVVQLELVQGVGGVRAVPEAVARHLAAGRARWGYLLLVDEVQTGMYRTGPFARSVAMGISPDLLVVGKGVSDMMFPFALVMYSAGLAAQLARAGSDLPAQFQARYGYEYGYKTVLNVLSRAAALGLEARVAESGELVERLLKAGVGSNRAVRAVRVFGLLIGIELDARRWPQRWLRNRLYLFYVLGMLRHSRGMPVLAGFCQYEPNVLKITPSLSSDPAVIREACATIVDVLNRPFVLLLAAAAFRVVRSAFFGRSSYGSSGNPVAAVQPAAC